MIIHELIHHVWLSIRLNNLKAGHKTNWKKLRRERDEEEVEVRERKGSTTMVRTRTQAELRALHMDQVTEESRPHEAADGRNKEGETEFDIV